MGVIVQLETGKRQPGGGSWEPKFGLPQDEEEVAEEEGSGWLAGSRRCSARSGNLWQPPRETSLVKGEYRKDVGLPRSGCSRPPRSPPNPQGPLCSPWGGCVSSGQGACSEAVPFGAAFIHRLLSGENCPHRRPTPSAQGRLILRRDGRTVCCHFRPARCVSGHFLSYTLDPPNPAPHSVPAAAAERHLINSVKAKVIRDSARVCNSIAVTVAWVGGKP